jgi:hypothetical protein
MMNYSNKIYRHQPLRDQLGRTIYVNSVHLDIYPLRYLLSAALLALLAPYLPTLLLISLIIAFAAVLGYNLIVLSTQKVD